MNRALYIGIYSNGTTSKMRADILRSILKDWEFQVIDTDIPKRAMSRIWQSIGFRYKRGPLIKRVNQYVLNNLNNEYYNLIWVDKAIYITPATTQILHDHTKALIHYTPDTALDDYNYSELFNHSLPIYNYAITTKSFELCSYKKIMGSLNRVIFVTQGYDAHIHKATVDFDDKKGLVFVGRYEKERAKLLYHLLQAGISINLAGPRWEFFAAKHKSFENLNYIGVSVVNADYSHLLSSSLIGLGLLAKLFPELHTTRTFEIPACGTALLTERNTETLSFFNEDEAIFYSSEEELLDKVKYYLSHRDELRLLTEKGYNRIHADGRDYESILRKVLQQIL